MPIYLLSSCGERASGSYEGFCQNSTYGGQAKLILTLNQNGESLSGKMTISGNLVGGGNVTGRVDGDQLSFVTSSADYGDISWMGEIKDGEISGYYLIGASDSILTSTPAQEGVWRVNKR